MGWDCVWKDMAQGPGTQCMRLAPAGQAEAGKGKPDEIGEMSSADLCEAYCCKLRHGTVIDGQNHAGGCDIWQWGPMAEMKASWDKQTSNCFVGVSDADRGSDAPYKCVGETMVRYAHVDFQSGRVCEGLAPAWGWTITLVLLLGGFAYFGGGAAYKHRASGARGWQSLPHARFWTELLALAQDGVAFVSGGGGGGGGGRIGGGYRHIGSGSGGTAARKRGKEEQRGASDGTRTGEELAKKSKKGKKSSKERAAVLAAAAAAATAEPSTPMAADAAAAGGTSSGTAAGGGGRWVHLPTS
jgi:hypothetical protein